MFVLGGALSQIGISLILAIIISAIILVAVMYAVAPLTAIDNNIVQAIAGIIFFWITNNNIYSSIYFIVNN
ncbi:hypothetical protein BJG89_07970 [Staphylococcus nepalensis]|uniref:hypothetical protein n=1 Tax=Staphylococcus TaxID=1279 RepID=UPI000BC318E9|nr:MULTISPECIES: hypothetical protein [Staphylococcus]ATH65273.1 hypothetical protein BJG89_07970 [Staphylococcus nepalensis]AWI44642.1 hypothetical protein BJG88_07765 [Staphylococcus nepalensis]NWN84654.1 hypothetical protein [Staphylococcus sp.]